LTASKETTATILRLHFVEKWKVGTIAMHLSIHHSMVTRILSQSGIPLPTLKPRASIIDDYLPFILDTLKKYPKLTASRLYGMVRERGYTGGPDHFRHQVSLHRPRPIPEAYLRLKTLPGEQAQVDWGMFGKITIGKAQRTLVAFVMVLSYSRRIFLRFYLDMQMANFLRGHAAAFEAWQGIPHILLYDNLKSAVLERQGDAIRFHPTLLTFAGHYRYEPRPVAVYRGNEKGRVERSIRYIRDNFFAARQWKDLNDLNAQAEEWCFGQSSDRPCPEDKQMTVREAFEEEKPRLSALPDNPYPTEECVEVRVPKTPYVRFDLNDYSVPYTYTRKKLVVRASSETVRILDGLDVIATHSRSYDKAKQIEDPHHVKALVERKRSARQSRGMNYLTHAVPACQILLNKAAEHGYALGGITSALLRLLDEYGAADLEPAVEEAIASDSPHPNTVRISLQRRREERNKPPPIPVVLPDKKQLRELVVRPHALGDYDQLSEAGSDTKPVASMDIDQYRREGGLV
jgi:transposase